jgi:mycoredoxin
MSTEFAPESTGGDRASVSGELVMYTTDWCGYCIRLKRFFERESIPFREVNIEHDAASAAFVASVNGGNWTVPTIRFPTGLVMTNPTPAQVRDLMARPA